MTDFELNKAIAKKLGINYFGNGLCIDPDGNYFDLPDYCNNWSDLMPLVIEYKINFRYAREINAYEVYNHLSEQPFHHCVSKDPQRALAECLLKVLSQCNK